MGLEIKDGETKTINSESMVDSSDSGSDFNFTSQGDNVSFTMNSLLKGECSSLGEMEMSEGEDLKKREMKMFMIGADEMERSLDGIKNQLKKTSRKYERVTSKNKLKMFVKCAEVSGQKLERIYDQLSINRL